MLRTPHFDYVELSHALHVPTRAQIHAHWRRYCRARFPGQVRAVRICTRMIDSWRPFPLLGSAGPAA